MDKFPKDDRIHSLLWNFLSEMVRPDTSSEEINTHNFQKLVSFISSYRQPSLSATPCFKTTNALFEHLDSYLKLCKSNNITSDEVPITTSTSSNITSESIASCLFHDLDFAKAMSLIGLSNYQTDLLK